MHHINFTNSPEIATMPQYFIIHKPFNVLSQFTSQEGKRTLKDFFDLPGNVYPIGRLDYDSEGLLIITDDKQLNHQLLNPQFSHEREYLAEVEGEITTQAIYELEQGVTITIDGKWYKTKPCTAKKISRPAFVTERDPPVRFRKNIPTSWLKLVLTEGKNRQVRKMTAKAGFPTLRLIRYRICSLTLEGLTPGEMCITSKAALYPLLFDSGK
ncbi:MAG TPA: pseudouridine synthase [Puia sp.]|jgi:23S rRNA pseudouridine2457 synthase|nr:pseudouridine synthase [Puia sp.]